MLQNVAFAKMSSKKYLAERFFFRLGLQYVKERYACQPCKGSGYVPPWLDMTFLIWQGTIINKGFPRKHIHISNSK